MTECRRKLAGMNLKRLRRVMDTEMVVHDSYTSFAFKFSARSRPMLSRRAYRPKP
jgi:hypothetical protein